MSPSSSSSPSKNSLALYGGPPVREALLPYGRQTIGEQDIQAVVKVLQSDYLTTGPQVAAFEHAFAQYVGTSEAVAVTNGTAALHAALHATGIQPGDEVLVPTITFAASANAVVYQGGTPLFCDVDPRTLLLCPQAVERLISPKTRAILAVDYAGHPCAYEELHALAQAHHLTLLDDACHALGGAYHHRPVGSLADFSTFSLHPVKPMTTGEGGMITTSNTEAAQKMRRFRNHGISTEFRQREEQATWYYELVELGYNYRITDFQCALGQSQLRQLPAWVAQRQALAQRYDQELASIEGITPLDVLPGISHAYHLYVVRLELERFHTSRREIFAALRAEGIGVNVHYIPVHLHPFYRHNYNTQPGQCPVAEKAYEALLSLPLFPTMSAQDLAQVIEAVTKVLAVYRR